jgi:F0F1-type ATP synthase membrane subunit b/b'
MDTTIHSMLGWTIVVLIILLVLIYIFKWEDL